MPPSDFYPVADVDALKKEYVGKTLDQIPTPAFVVDKSIVAKNCDNMLQRAQKMGAHFRAHVKTHKSTQGVEYQLGENGSRVVVSTLMEAWKMKDFYKSGKITDVLYGLPVVKSRIDELVQLSEHTNVRLMIDHPCQLDMLVKHSKEQGIKKPWSFFIKVNMGTNRAGKQTGSEELTELIKAALAPETKDYLQLYGFYCHAGHSYASKSSEEACGFLKQEIDAANAAAKTAESIAGGPLGLTISVGSTPTAHSFGLVDTSKLGLVADLELHAGNYPFCDLQQMATHCIDQSNVACSVLAEVASCYPGRGDKGPGEVLINAGVIALAREPGPYPGFGQVSTKGLEGWHVGRLSQEHGILTPKDGAANVEFPELGQRLRIIPQHSCITANAFPWYYVVDGDEKVVDVWTAWRGW